MKLLKTMLKKILILLGFRKISFVKKYYSGDGEDALLQTFYEGKMGVGYNGFYIDIGAHHPMRFSNTHLFYEKGWWGINIDATPGSMKEFNKTRKRDINIEAGISGEHGELEYYSFYESALNSFSKVISEERINSGWKLKEIIRIKTFPINDILEKHLPKNQHIDFITMDIEGLELSVLKSLDFEKYAPDYFLVEDLGFINKDFMEYKTSEVFCLLNQKGYNLVAKTMRTSLFKKCIIL